jgi:hypothetical protein
MSNVRKGWLGNGLGLVGGEDGWKVGRYGFLLACMKVYE